MRKFEKTFKNVKFVKYSTSDPHADLSILGKADHAIGKNIIFYYQILN